ncbi:MAG: hypothetical protein JSS51_07615 [Planctomycetes bacterium]|nr:hypothetical protein [Planctomycetota bacterium]
MAKLILRREAGRSVGDALVEEILRDLRFNRADAIVMIAVPSHDHRNKPLDSGLQSRWATAAMEKFRDLFVGATAMPGCKGIYRSDAGTTIWDEPILVQSFCATDVLQEERTVRELVSFARKMRVDLKQDAVMVVFNNLMKFIKAER